MTSQQLEARKKLISLRLGGILIASAVWVIVLPSLIPWVWPPLITAAFILVAAAASITYDRLILAKPGKPWMMNLLIIAAALITIAAIIDGTLRQAYRAGDCLRWESEIVTGLPGERADAAAAFQALKCTPSGGILERSFGASSDAEANLRHAKENDARLKADLSPLN